MIKKILKIKNFGSFTNFEAKSDLKEFQKYNLFFGLNGSGKTTLSKLFKCLNDGNISKDLDDKAFKEDFDILIDENQHITEFQENTYCNYIKIFNQDFVNNNLFLDNNNAQTNALTYTIGEVAKDIKEKISELNSKLLSYYIDVQGKRVLISQNDYENKQKELEGIYKASADKIRFDLQIKNAPEYNKKHFEQDYFRNENVTISITENEKNENANKYIQPVKNTIAAINIDVITNNTLTEIETLLSKEIKRANIKEELVQWLEKGILFEESEKICPFCNNPIANWKQRYNEIQNIVKKDDNYIEYEKRLSDFLLSLHNALGIIKNNLFALRIDDFCNKISQEILDNYATIYNNYQKFIENLIELLNQKKKNPDNIFSIIDKSVVEQYITIKNTLNQLITEHNTNIANNESIRNNAKNLVIQYYIQECKENVLNIINQLNDIESKIKQDNVRIQLIENEIKTLNAELTNQKAPMAEIEKYIYIVFGHKKFNLIYIESDKSYYICRENGEIAKNLSEGEKTVIAFAYFLATLKTRNFDLKNAIVVIDDPVSSLDQQYLFNLINLLALKFNKTSSFGQLFVLTHNFYFFKKFRAILKYKKENGNAIYELFQINKRDSSIIENADDYLRDFTSEYTHTIKYLKQVQALDETKIKEIPLGNSIRKILEIFLAFRCPRKSNISLRFNVVTKDLPEEEKGKYLYLQDIANASSHTEECEDLESLEEFKLFVTKNEIEQLFNFIKLIDEKHYNEIMRL